MSDSTFACDRCGDTVTLARNGRQLAVSCQCNVQMIRVSSTLPERWNDE